MTTIPYVTPTGAAPLLGVNRQRVHQLIDSGQLKTVQTACGMSKLIALRTIKARLAKMSKK